MLSGVDRVCLYVALQGAGNLPSPYESWDRLLVTPVILSSEISVYGNINE